MQCAEFSKRIKSLSCHNKVQVLSKGRTEYMQVDDHTDDIDLNFVH